MYQTLNRT